MCLLLCVLISIIFDFPDHRIAQAARKCQDSNQAVARNRLQQRGAAETTRNTAQSVGLKAETHPKVSESSVVNNGAAIPASKTDEQ